LALLLARAGVAVTLVDSRPDPSGLLRGDGLMPSGLEALERMGLAALLEALPRRELRAWSFVVEGRPLFSVPEPMGSPVACSLIDTAALLQALLEQADHQPSLTVLKATAVRDLRLAAGRVAGVELEDGRQLPADLVVACDGRGSLLRRRAGLERPAQGPPVEVLWFELGGAAAAPLLDWLDSRFVTLVGEGASCALFSTARGALRVGWLQAPGGRPPAAPAKPGSTPAGAWPAGAPPAEPVPWPECLARLSPPDLAPLWRHLGAADLPAPLKIAVQPALAPRWCRPGLLLLGDAAHPMSPVRAQGLNMALRDALVAAEQLLPLLLPAAPGPQGPAEPPGPAPQKPLDRGQWLQELDRALVTVADLRLAEIRAVQSLQRQELGRAKLLRQRPWLRRLVAATARWSGPLLARRWRAGQPTLRDGLPLP
jgi:2-polyprenyl-6-methoxyphenol hydroxylase-like FAD-dependent oxidoreductase